MNRQQASALILYMQRALGIVPTTGAEWISLSGALTTIEGIANGVIEITVAPTKVVEAAEVAPATTS